jgi:hypothetical protein
MLLGCKAQAAVAGEPDHRLVGRVDDVDEVFDLADRRRLPRLRHVAGEAHTAAAAAALLERLHQAVLARELRDGGQDGEVQLDGARAQPFGDEVVHPVLDEALVDLLQLQLAEGGEDVLVQRALIPADRVRADRRVDGALPLGDEVGEGAAAMRREDALFALVEHLPLVLVGRLLRAEALAVPLVVREAHLDLVARLGAFHAHDRPRRTISRSSICSS